MSSTEALPLQDLTSVWRRAWLLALFTIGYNIVEGAVSVAFGVSDEALTLFGFGVDSFIEVVSAIGIAHMILRLRKHGSDRRDEFERTALRITGGAFYALTAMLVVTAVLSVITGHAPETTLPGLIISVVSIAFMWALISGKTSVGRTLRSEPILADANCSKVCLRMSIVVLVASALHEVAQIPYVDAAGALWLAWYSWSEGKESFEKARTNTFCGCDHC
jgi:hypothetical protein